MTEEFIESLSKQNIELFLEDGSLKFRSPKGALTKEVLSEIKNRKSEIIDYLVKKTEENDKSILFSPITPVPKKDSYPLSATQKRMFVLNRLDGKSTSYNTTITLKINGRPDVKKLEMVFDEIVSRHESLRTTFTMIDGEPAQIIHETAEFKLEYEELYGKTEKIEDEVKSFIKPYDLGKLPLFRLRLIKMVDSENLFFLIIDIHHIISDGVSASIIIKEINALYNGEELPRLEIHYKDYAAWHEKLISSSLLIKEKEYWQNQLSGELPVLDIACDYSRPAVFSSSGESLHYIADSELTSKLRIIARENKATIFTLLLAAYNILMAKYSRQNDIIVGTPIAGRIHEDTYKLCGVFLNTLPLRNHPDGNKTCEEFIREVTKNSLQAFDNQDYPFDRLVEDMNIERDTSRNPVFSTMFVMQNMEAVDIEGKDFKSSRFDIKHKMAQVDITVNVTEINDKIDFEFNYCTALFSPDTIKGMTTHFDNILRFIIEYPDRKIADIELMSEAEKKMIQQDFNRTFESFENVPLHALFEKAAEQYPQNIALKIGDEEVSYASLNNMANNIADKLIKLGVKPEKIVGIICDPSVFMAASILGILKAGGAYLPIKPDFPSERIDYMISDSNCSIVITDDIYKDKSNLSITKSDLSKNEAAAQNPTVIVNSKNLAYIIYTSGTTGKPKGVMIEHGAISKTIQWRTKVYNMKPGEKSLELFSYCFDGFLASFFPALSSGGCVVMLQKNQEKDPDFIAKTIKENKLTALISVPMVFSTLLSIMSEKDLKGLTRVTLAGDKTPAELIKRCKEKCPWTKLINEYGPTENSIVSTINWNMTETSNNVIGKPVSNSSAYILGENSELLPVGIPGELCVSGERLARGYLNREDLTAEKFIPHPYLKGERLYKTGDVAKWLPDGNIAFLGRSDFQVKIRGYRIETSEIEAVLLKNKDTEDAAVIVKNDNAGNKYLCAYIVSNKNIDTKAMREYLLKSLPEYMVPAKFMKIDSLPLSNNGKLDRKALPEPEDDFANSKDYKKPETSTEKAVAAVWEEVLGNKNIGVNFNFFEVGGDSMSIVRLHDKLSAIYPDCLTVSDLFTYSTIEKIAKAIDNVSKETSNNNLSLQSEKKNDNEDIAVIGISVNLPGAKTISELWKIINEKKNCIKEMPKSRLVDAEKLLGAKYDADGKHRFEKISYLDEVDKFDNGFFKITPVEAKYMDPNQRLFLEQAYSAAEDAGYGGKLLSGTKTGVYTGFCGDSDYGRFIADNEPQSYSVAAAGNITSVIAGRVSYFLNLKGPAVVINTACSSSLAAIHYACSDIKSGVCDMAIVGGVKLWLASLEDQFSMGIESKANLTKTFDDSADGTAKGEGAAAVMLKPLSKAKEDGDTIYAVIKSTAINQDGTSNGLTAPDPAAQSKVIESAWISAGIDPETIGYIEAHGTGTKLGDPIEIDGITKAFRKFTDKKQFCAVSSVKSNFGHTDNLAGVLSFIKGIIALKYKQLPPTANFEVPNKAIDFVNSPVYVNDKASEWKTGDYPRRAGVSAFGLSGTNCHVVLEEAPEKGIKSDDGNYDIFTISAMNSTLLKKLIDKYRLFLRYNEKVNLHDLCFTANTGRFVFDKRIAVIAKDVNELTSILEKISSSLDDSEEVLKKSEFVWRDNSPIINNNSIDNLRKIATRYLSGENVNFNKLYENGKPNRVHLPTYPFERKRCWVDIEAKSAEQQQAERYFTVSWDEKPTQLNLAAKNLIVVYKNNYSEKIIKELRKICATLVIVLISEQFKKVGEHEYLIRPIREDFSEVFASCSFKSVSIVSLASFADEIEPKSVDGLKNNMCDSVSVLSEMTAALKMRRFSSAELIAVSDNVTSVNGNEKRVNAVGAAVFGLVNSISAENPTIHCRCIDADELTDSAALAAECCGDFTRQQIAYRCGKRYGETLRPLYIDAQASVESNLKSTGVYIVTGGIGRLGFASAQMLTHESSVNLALLTRKDSKTLSADKQLQNKIADMKSSGSNAFCVTCDITDEDSLKSVLTILRNKYGRINGIIHCAAVGVGKAQKAVGEESLEVMDNIIAPKVYGTYILDELTRVDKPDFFVCFSSGITLMGGKLTSAYTIANSYLDSFAFEREKRNLNTLTIDWPVFIDKIEATPQEMRTLMFKPVTVKNGLSYLLTLLAKRVTRVAVGELNYECDLLHAKLPFSICEKLLRRQEQAIKIESDNEKSIILKGRATNAYSNTEKTLAKIWGEALSCEEIEINSDFFETGGNSLLAIRLETCAEKHAITLSPDDIYNYPTVAMLAAHLDDKTLESTAVATIKECAATNAQTIKQIDNIEPFNEVFYRNCFFNSFFPILKHYGKSVNQILANDIAVMKFCDNELEVEYLSAEALDRVIDHIGISICCSEYTDDINKLIIEGIDNNKPSIVWVDCFYEPIRNDLYQKEHWAHTILIYGYDEIKSEYLVIEHSVRENLSYEKKSIAYKDLLKMCVGYEENFRNTVNEPCLTVFSAQTDAECKYYEDNYLKTCNKFRKDALESINNFKEFTGYFYKTICSENTFKTNGEALLNSVNNVINAARAERYTVKAIFGQKAVNLEEMVDKIISLLSEARRIVAKCIYKDEYDQNRLKTAAEILSSICELLLGYSETKLHILTR